jgi:hypothetical protein
VNENTVTNPLTITIPVLDDLLERIAAALADHPDATGTVLEDVLHDATVTDDAFDLFNDALKAIVLTQQVEAVFLTLADDPLFMMHLAGEYEDETVNGSTFADDVMAAKMLQDAAPEGSPLKDTKLYLISVALLAVMSRYGVSRGEERTRQERIELWATGVFRRNADGKVELHRPVDDDEDDQDGDA